jgi:hypothetical protein
MTLSAPRSLTIFRRWTGIEVNNDRAAHAAAASEAGAPPPQPAESFDAAEAQQLERKDETREGY